MDNWITATREVIHLWFAICCLATWLALLTAAFVWFCFRKSTAEHEGKS